LPFHPAVDFEAYELRPVVVAPVIVGMVQSDANLTFGVTRGSPGGGYTLITTTNAALSIANWTNGGRLPRPARTERRALPRRQTLAQRHRTLRQTRQPAARCH